MTSEQEWAEAKRTASRSAYDRVVTQDELGAVGREAFVIHDRLHKKADVAGIASRPCRPRPGW
ncbi:hypothetical protein ABZ565_32410 [Streptomyces sp. NPDC016469]|uniref:hypothetical protein n=1 Tax=Streptomyces sp. NPDC016469 TaxID=3157191 RepID=UPI0033FED6D1